MGQSSTFVLPVVEAEAAGYAFGYNPPYERCHRSSSVADFSADFMVQFGTILMTPIVTYGSRGLLACLIEGVRKCVLD
jgi:hypothetical protein